jgi:hypothetical protein
MSKAKTAAATKPAEETIEIQETGFSAEELAALDKAAATPETVTVEADSTEGQPETEVSAEDQIKDLQKQLADQKAKTAAAESDRKANQVNRIKQIEEAETAEQGRFRLAEEKLASDKALAANELDAAKKAYRDAYESGDPDKVVEANDKLFEAKTRVKVLDDNEVGLKRFKQDRENFWKTSKDGAIKKAETGNEVDVDLEQFTPAARAWVDKHPEFLSDKKFYDNAVKAHYAARGEGIEEDTPAYFAFIEKRLGLDGVAQPSQEDIESEAAARGEQPVVVKPKEPAKKPVTSAPPSRGDNPTPKANTDKRFKTLTAQQAEHAKDSGMTHEEYWDSLNLDAATFEAKYGYPNK